MAYFKLLSGKKDRPPRDPFAGLTADALRGEARPKGESEFREAYETKWEPPDGARTFADHDLAAAHRLASNRPHVIIREDPMFGRRGYAREVAADPKYGYLVLVIAFRGKRDPHLGWVEPHKPRDEERMYWPPSKVEFA